MPPPSPQIPGASKVLESCFETFPQLGGPPKPPPTVHSRQNRNAPVNWWQLSFAWRSKAAISSVSRNSVADDKCVGVS